MDGANEGNGVPFVLVGIDEAGYGPVLGPLVISAFALHVPPSLIESDLWSVLKRGVSRKPVVRGRRIPICDSKQLHNPQQGVGRLERSALTLLAAAGSPPPDVPALLRQLCPHACADLAEYPWYREGPVLPLANDAAAVRIAARVLDDELRRQGVTIAGIWSEVLPEGHFNRQVAQTRNKSEVLAGLMLRLIQRAADAWPDRALVINVDKQGGRDHYGALLRRAFDHRNLKIVEEGERRSSYEMAGEGPVWRICFAEGSEDRCLPVAAASLVSKYVREAMMSRFNHYWRQFDQALKPTAGYYKDGQRFLRDIEPLVQRFKVDRSLLVRMK